MSLLERVGFSSIFNLFLRAFVGIMSLVFALEAGDLTQVSLRFWIWAMLPIVMVMASMSISLVTSIVSLESTIMVMTMVSVATSSSMVVPMFMTMAYFMRKVLLE